MNYFIVRYTHDKINSSFNLICPTLDNNIILRVRPTFQLIVAKNISLEYHSQAAQTWETSTLFINIKNYYLLLKWKNSYTAQISILRKTVAYSDENTLVWFASIIFSFFFSKNIFGIKRYQVSCWYIYIYIYMYLYLPHTHTWNCFYRNLKIYQE